MLQSWLHFMKLMKLAKSRDEALRVLESMHNIIRTPIQDTLEIRNGLTYSAFLEGIIRTAYYRLDDQGLQEQDGALKDILEEMFNEGNIELKKRMMEDRLVSELYSHDNCKIFYQHNLLLTSIFEQKATF